MQAIQSTYSVTIDESISKRNMALLFVCTLLYDCTYVCYLYIVDILRLLKTIGV